MDKKYLESAILFARLYGIAETLNPWENMENEKFLSMIQEWTEEFLSMESEDILKFFEQKTRQKKTGHNDCIK